ncbi:MAG: hypothetical protein II059_11085 [Clostridia bacterium]|nr:hypothetical protein [Clostridia bacterium]
MSGSTGKKIAIFAVIALVVFGAVFLGITLTKDVGKTQDQITGEEAEKKIGDLLSQVKVENVNTKKQLLMTVTCFPRMRSFPIFRKAILLPSQAAAI